MPMLDVIISLDRDHHDRLPEVADRLRASGVNVNGELTMLHTITGTVDEHQLADVERVKGVRKVSLARQLRAV